MIDPSQIKNPGGSLTAAELCDLALTLENEGKFYAAYLISGTEAFQRRECIDKFSHRTKTTLARDREQLRRYFDERWQMPPATFKQYPAVAQYPDFDFHNPLKSVPATSSKESRDDSLDAIAYGIQQLTPKKEDPMNQALEITTKTFINGIDISGMTPADIYSLIAAQELQIDTLDKIKAKPKKLLADLAARKAGIQALVDYLDAQA